ncbi:hypothetical protein TNCV_4323411 [Trichonephila clavipes]|nr:hypothetical protein TNCV_4323411 [Trichonephila clavipes]
MFAAAPELHLCLSDLRPDTVILVKECGLRRRKATRETKSTVWQKLFVKPLMKMMEKGDLAVAVDGSWQKRIFLRRNGFW